MTSCYALWNLTDLTAAKGVNEFPFNLGKSHNSLVGMTIIRLLDLSNLYVKLCIMSLANHWQ